MKTETMQSIRAVEYVRMSTDPRQISIAYQKQAIREYAQQHDLIIVRTYADEAKSGLTVKGRLAFIDMIETVREGRADFGVILIYDVSRFGRFQDLDESGYHEFLCRKAGVRIEYVAETFKNDGEPLSAMAKSLKRAWAAEFSREQSERVFRSQCQVAKRGFFAGGSLSYGFRRMLVSEDGQPRGLLLGRTRKAYRGDRIVLVPGPAEELETVRRIFRLFAEEKLLPTDIAAQLNGEGKFNAYGRPWDPRAIRFLLRNERYVGTLLYNRVSFKLRSGRPKKNDPDAWIRAPHAIEPIVSEELFARAREVLHERSHHRWTKEELVERLKFLLAKHGYLSVRLIREDSNPDIGEYCKKFGNPRNCYAQIGYVHDRDRRDEVRQQQLWIVVRDFTVRLLTTAKKDAGLTYHHFRDGISSIGTACAIAVRAAPYEPTPVGKQGGWTLYLHRQAKPDLTIVLRMQPSDNTQPLDFFLLPAEFASHCRVRIAEANLRQFKPYQYQTEAAVFAAVIEKARAWQRSKEPIKCKPFIRPTGRRLT